MRIYLAELFHTFVDANRETSPYTVPLGIGFLGAMIQRKLPGVDVGLYRDPDELLAAIEERPPQVLGLSLCNWNVDLSRRLAQHVKARRPETALVVGGPSVDDEDAPITDLLRDFPGLDYVIPSEGENGIVALLAHLGGGGDRSGGAVIPGVAYLDPAGALVRGKYFMPSVAPAGQLVRPNARTLDAFVPAKDDVDLDEEIPSPYLTGLLDRFLAQGLTPILQTMRGCPYRCEFCVSGSALWNKPRGFALERVKAEIAYLAARSKTPDLLLTDENWGILGERDLEIARHLLASSQQSRWPGRVYYYTAKIVNDASRAIVETIKPIAWGAELIMSFQSLNADTRKAIKRTNIGLDKVEENVRWANQRGITTGCEMIYGFPHETPATFCDGVETLLARGMHSVLVYPLQLFDGIDLASRERRAECGFQTKFRFAEGSFGIYAGGEVVAVEKEEIVVGTRWSTFDDYLKIRRYGFFLQLLLVREFFKEFVKLCEAAGIAAAPLARHLAFADLAASPTLAALMAEYQADATAELHDTVEDLYRAFSEKLVRGESIEGVKLNLVYMAKLFSSSAATEELLAEVGRYVSAASASEAHRRVIIDYLREVLANRIVKLEADAGETNAFESRFDYGRWAAGEFRDLEDLHLPSPRPLRGTVHGDLRSNLQGFDPTSVASLQAVIDHTPAKHLLRAISTG